MSKGYKYHNGKRMVGGTAALLHRVKLDGGLEAHYHKVVSKAIDVLIDEGCLEMSRPKLKLVVGGKE